MMKLKNIYCITKSKWFGSIKNIYNRNGKGELMKNGFPTIWTKEFVGVHITVV